MMFIYYTYLKSVTGRWNNSTEIIKFKTAYGDSKQAEN